MSDDRLFPLDDIPLVPLMPPVRRRHGAQIEDERISHDYPPQWSRCPKCQGTGRVLTIYHGTVFGTKCDVCLGMGSVKARVRLEAGHRCVRCQHPYIPKGDAKMLGVEPTPYHWSPCDPRCTHMGPIRWRNAAEQDEWKYQDLDERGERAGDGIIDFGPSGEPIWRYDVEAEWRILTVHHLDGDKANLAWWNLASLCQRCHLEIQAKVVLDRVYTHEHSEWFKPYVAAYYAWVYRRETLTRDETMARLDELLALELA